jgi:transposase-like protein
MRKSAPPAPRTRQQRQAYSIAFKRKAIKKAQQAKNVSVAARELGIPIANLHHWLRAERNRAAITQPKPPAKRKPSARQTYSATFKHDAVQQALASGSISITARELNVAVQTLHNWVIATEEGKMGIKLTLTKEEIDLIYSLCTKRLGTLKSISAKRAQDVNQEETQLRFLQRKLNRLSR